MDVVAVCAGMRMEVGRCCVWVEVWEATWEATNVCVR